MWDTRTVLYKESPEMHPRKCELCRHSLQASIGTCLWMRVAAKATATRLELFAAFCVEWPPAIVSHETRLFPSAFYLLSLLHTERLRLRLYPLAPSRIPHSPKLPSRSDYCTPVRTQHHVQEHDHHLPRHDKRWWAHYDAQLL